MEEEIINLLAHPDQLEKLYRNNKIGFKKAFNQIYFRIQNNPAAQIWNSRLNFEHQEISWGSMKELIFMVLAGILAGAIAKIPSFFGLDETLFYLRNISFIVFPFLIIYFSWRQKTKLKKNVLSAVVILISLIYINILPDNETSNTLILACIHLPLLLWCVLGFSFLGNHVNSIQKRLNFLQFNGDLIVMTTILLIAGGIMTGITIGLFELIKIQIHEFYFNYIVIWGLAASPIIGTYLVQSNPQMVNKVSPIVAKVFTPLVLVTLIVYLFALVSTGKSPLTDREYLFIFNMLLIGVMAIIFFSIAEISKNSNRTFAVGLLLALSVVTVIVNGIAFYAILYRIIEWGITPNRLAILGGNTLILANLIMVVYQLFKSIVEKNAVEKVEKSIALFLPIYCIWTVIVIFVFPLIFNFK